MRTSLACSFAITVALCACAGAPGAQTSATTAATQFRRGTVEAKSWGGPIQGPWEWSKEVKVTTADLTMTCDRLKMWPTADGRDWERIEASGKIEIHGKYLATDKTEWKVVAKAEAATYDAKAGQAVLKGSVDFQATNQSTGAVLSAAGEKLIYDTNTRQFRFERSDAPVRVEWRQPVAEEKPAQEQAPPKGEETK